MCQVQLCWLLSLGIHTVGPGEGSLIYPLGIHVFSLLASDSKKMWGFFGLLTRSCCLEVNTLVVYVVFNFFQKYSGLNKMLKDFQPYYDLWTTVSDWIKWNVSWMNDSLLKIEAEELEKNVNDSVKTMQRCVKQFKDSPGRCTVWGKEVGADQHFDVKHVTECSKQGLSGSHMCIRDSWENANKVIFRFFFLKL